MSFQTNLTLLVLLNLFIFLANATVLNLVKLNKKKSTSVVSNVQSVLISLFIWLLVALPISSIFIIKTNTTVTSVFNNVYLFSVFIVLNTIILIVYNKYYKSFTYSSNIKTSKYTEFRKVYEELWYSATFLITVYLFCYILFIFL